MFTPIRVIVTSVELHNSTDIAAPVIFRNVLSGHGWECF